MLWYCIATFVITIVWEILITAHLLFVVERNKHLAAISSATIEVLKYAPYIMLFEIPTISAKVIFAAVTALGCGIGSYIAMWGAERFGKHE